LPDIDFAEFSVLMAAPGMKPTSGYSAVFLSINETKDRIVAHVLALGPGTCGSLQALMPGTAAYALIPRTKLPVRFAISNASTDCTVENATRRNVWRYALAKLMT
jgi:hypothetical protein